MTACTVVVPTHRRPRALAACLAGLAAQTDPPADLQVVVVDDGGGVPLGPVVDAVRRPPRRDPGDPGQRRPGGGAQRRRRARARGALLAFTDDDCVPRPGWLRTLVDLAGRHPGAAVSGRTVNALRDNPYSAAAQLVIDVGYEQTGYGSRGVPFFTTNNLLVPAEAFRALGGFDTGFRTAEDRDFCARWAASGRRFEHAREAVVDHAHALGLWGFVRLHYEYGRGARRFHRAQASRGGRVAVEPGYYLALARRPLREPPPAAGRPGGPAGGVAARDHGRLRPGAGGRMAVSGVDVLHVLWSGRIGGIERQVATMLRHADRRGGLRHRACLLDGAGVVGDALVAEGRAVRLGMRAGWDPEGLARLARLARRLRPRAVHLHTHAVAAHVVLGAALPRALTVYTEHSPRVLTRDGKFRALYRLLRARNARLVALSPAMAAAMIAQGASPGAITIVPEPGGRAPGARVRRTAGAADGTVGVVARLAPQKRIDLLLDVVDRLRREGTACRGLVVGGGALAGDLARRRAALGLEDAVDLAGEQEDVVPWLDRMDVFLMTSAFEPFGIAALEAMARGVPVVAMPCPGGLGELAAGGGRLLPDRSVATAAGAVAQLLASPGERSLARARGRVVVGRHGPGPVLARLEAVYAAGGLTTPASRPGA